MNATYVAPVLTPLSFEDAHKSLSAAMVAEVGGVVTLDAIALVEAKCALETGRFKTMYLWNFGNRKAGTDSPGMYTCFRCNEVIGKSTIWFSPDSYPCGEKKDGSPWDDSWLRNQRWEVPPGHPQTRFAAFANRFDGAYEYVSFLARNKRYQSAWQALLTGDPAQFVRALKKANYFTADEAPYMAGVTSLWSEYRRRIAGTQVVAEERYRPDEWWELKARVQALQFDTLSLLGSENHRDMIA